jgi:hypothetical protein
MTTYTYTSANSFRELALKFRPIDPPLSQPWFLKERPGTGIFIATHHGSLLCRVDQKSGLIFLWDRAVRREVVVPIRELFSAFLGV